MVVNPAGERGAREVTPSAAEAAWREAHTTGAAAAQQQGGDPLQPPEPVQAPEVAFEVAYVQTVEEAARAVQSALLDLR